MRRDPDLERQSLLAVEAYDPHEHPEIDLSSFTGHSARQASHQVMLLAEAKLIAADEVTDGDGLSIWWIPMRLTMAGHECLDTIRDEEVWRRTKDGARAVGSFSLEVLGTLARGFVREKIRRHTGVEVDL